MLGWMQPRAALPAPPRSRGELLLRARALEDRTLGELCLALGARLPASPVHGKGLCGQLVERALGARAGSAPTPDFPELGVELKTIPVAGGKPRESTFVCQIAPREIAYEEWPTSRVRKKLGCVLWVPLEMRGGLEEARFGAPRLWSPSPTEEAELRADWEELAGLIATGGIEEVTAHRGRHLQVRPKAAHGRVRQLAPGPDDIPIEALPRGFYLRARFTGRLLGGPAGAKETP